jgi:hypothetical protein
LQFIDLIVNQKQDEALAYARSHFAQFAPTQMSEIQHLMGSFVYAKRLNKSPYAGLFHPNNMPTLWDGIFTIWVMAGCKRNTFEKHRHSTPIYSKQLHSDGSSAGQSLAC